jgi:hypothetical protein
MSHSLNDRQRERRDADVNRKEIARQQEVVREDLSEAGNVVEVWNSRLATGRELLFTPTIRAAIMAHTPMLTFSCPACGVTGTADLRKLDRHPQTPVTSLIPSLSCQRCRPNPPFAKLTGLLKDPADNRERNLYWEAYDIVRRARNAAMRRQRDEE